VGEFLSRSMAALADRIERQAIVRPSGMAGALVAGYYQVFPPPYRYRLFDARAPALEWLGHPADALAAVDAHVGGEPLVRRLQKWLAGGAPRRSVEEAARALAVSRRSLQRRLAGAGTSFAREVKRAQIERAMQLLETTDKKLGAVAAEVGCRSLASFSEMFAREVGAPPSVWRAGLRR
jgi:AraC-like DNA-binding protein